MHPKNLISTQPICLPDNPVILCIGTPFLTGDCLGPLTGSLLLLCGCPYPVYGTLSAPVHAQNLSACLLTLQTQYPDRPVLAVDAALGPETKIGSICFHGHGLRPGVGVGKELGLVGDCSITGIVSTCHIPAVLALSQVHSHIVHELAFGICRQILSLQKR